MNQRQSPSERDLIVQLTPTTSAEERSRLISQLDALPIGSYAFNHRWLVVHDIRPYQCWTDEGYDPSLDDCPRDIQLLAATSYGKLTIENGGFHSFFRGWIGIFAPEMTEWFERAGLAETAQVVKEATSVFGRVFPRSQDLRRQLLASFPGEAREEWDPFSQMDDRFYASLPYGGDAYDAAADRWLREVCGIKSLHDTLEGRNKH
jgi:Domain of unknown function (DUF4375)